MRLTLLTTALLISGLSQAAGTVSAPSLSAAQVLERNAQARGGAASWRAVKTLSWSGKMDAGGNTRATLAMPAPKNRIGMPAPRPSEQAQVPFVLTMERPRKSRVEVQFAGQTAVQVYDGEHGWKLRPYLNRREVEDFKPEELKAAAEQADIEGPLMSSSARGATASLAGVEEVDGSPAYKIALTYKDKRVQNVWVDSKTFLEVKMDGVPRVLDGRSHAVWIFLRDYKTVSGLVMPMRYETSVLGVKSTESIVIEKVDVNPSVPDAKFAKPV